MTISRPPPAGQPNQTPPSMKRTKYLGGMIAPLMALIGMTSPAPRALTGFPADQYPQHIPQPSRRRHGNPPAVPAQRPPWPCLRIRRTSKKRVAADIGSRDVRQDRPRKYTRHGAISHRWVEFHMSMGGIQMTVN